jgi:hypothetical protein
MLLWTFPSFINLFLEHSFYEKVVFVKSGVADGNPLLVCGIQILLTRLKNASPDMSFL